MRWALGSSNRKLVVPDASDVSSVFLSTCTCTCSSFVRRSRECSVPPSGSACRRADDRRTIGLVRAALHPERTSITASNLGDATKERAREISRADLIRSIKKIYQRRALSRRVSGSISRESFKYRSALSISVAETTVARARPSCMCKLPRNWIILRPNRKPRPSGSSAPPITILSLVAAKIL